MRPVRHLWRRVGRRGSFLLFLATLDVLYSLSLAKPQAEALRSPTVEFIQDVAPLWVWAALWGGVGVICAAGAFVHHDRWAYAAAMALKVLWGTTFLLGWAIVGLDRGWVSAVIWLVFAVVILLISTWPEPPMEVSPTKGQP